ncbi:hypothetical protein CB0940_10381 [Cercospora beticola]|uniref:Uncharacterized protein n=1 Tax=Cercospora beticola TaxID=122368 RepID=A0A2G5HVE0_CERBT|nr:hypothetical protein CB0940_10381 [Cercospora beticola]PIA96253.1 hypothetical protein CB0940_10381 [Cercospora beticola]WPB07098.1 hypothetical protein RHO25_011758 [Cercospora beticola]
MDLNNTPSKVELKRPFADMATGDRPAKRQSISPLTSPSFSRGSTVTLDGDNDNVIGASRKIANNLAGLYTYFSEQTPPPPSPGKPQESNISEDMPMETTNDEETTPPAATSAPPATDSDEEYIANAQAALKYVDPFGPNGTEKEMLEAIAQPIPELAFRPFGLKNQSSFAQDLFEDQPIPLSSLRYPPISKNFPDVKDELLDLYIKLNTFNVKVWSNYDASKKKFFDDEPRLSDCGRLILSPNVRMRLEVLDSGRVGLELPKVEMEIGTAFRTLGVLYLKWVKNGIGGLYEVEVSAVMLEGYEYDWLNWPRGPVRQQISVAMNQVAARPKEEWEGKGGFKLGDLDFVASMFLRLRERGSV